MGTAEADRPKYPNCGLVFDEPWHLTLVHVMSTKLLKYPACGKSAMMPTDVEDPGTWPPVEA